ncbi:PadR family transcriptional regulator [Dyella jiangningensis]|jgi:DNA-binding PadR family transcriptional regulator|uniref:PadR family transcriptional regulator n=1 Tax=Dyella jiangningensis TaxID=1379159 RepID=UPI00240EB117|nr:PadR family transcriptional regulator [Dyella jiangningensis]MDG2536608.1 PadR family transcriptional regulator [Dyella jiangningensis]
MRFHHCFDHHHHHHHEGREAWIREAMGFGRGRGFGRGFGDDEGPGGWGGMGGRFRGGRVFGHGDLKLILLSLIAEQPRHGYELIRTIEEMFDGAYAPSPGAVYPTLTLLEELGHASVQNDEGKKLYTITEEGKAFLTQNKDAVDAVMSRMEQTAKMFARAAAPMALREAMHNLKRALFMHGGPWNAAEVKRIRDIIQKAADEIAKGGKDA